MAKFAHWRVWDTQTQSYITHVNHTGRVVIKKWSYQAQAIGEAERLNGDSSTVRYAPKRCVGAA